MPKPLLLFEILLILSVTRISAQKTLPLPRETTKRHSWSAGNHDPFGKKNVFIENKGQYRDLATLHTEMGKVQFAYEGLDMPVFFTPKGLVHLQRRPHHPDNRVITMQWLNANPHPVILEEDKVPTVYTYGLLQQKIGACKRLIYKDLYPGVDVEYSFTGGSKAGFEYLIRARPGANLDQVQMSYGGDVKGIRDSAGILFVRSDIDSIIETKPVSYYADDPQSLAPVTSHALKGNKRGFAFSAKRDHFRGIVIDPFVTGTSTALTGANAGKVMQVDYDYNGDVYVQGGTNTQGQIAKYDASGNLLWTFSGIVPAASWQYGDNYGGWTVEKTTGNVYVGIGSNGYGGQVIRLNGVTGLYDNYKTPDFKDEHGQNGENWKMRWFCNGGTPQVMIAGGSGGIGSYDDNIGILLLPTTNFISYNITGITTYPYNQDVSDFVIDPANNDIYSILASGNTPAVSNRIYKNRYPYTANNQVWNALSGYTVLREDNNTPYMTGDVGYIGGSNQTNSLAVTSSYLFYYDGHNLKAIDKATGAQVGTALTFANQIALMQQGIYADECTHVYIGTNNGIIKVLRFNGTAFDDNADPDITIPGYTGRSIYALTFDPGHQLLYAAGDGFVGAFDISSYCTAQLPTNPVPYILSVQKDCASAIASISPAPPAGAVVTYTLLNSNTVIGSNATGRFTGLEKDKPYVIRADVNQGCSDVLITADVVLTSLTINLKVMDVCGGIPNSGSVTVLTGGLTNLSYSIDGTIFQSDSVFKDLAANTYKVFVNDGGACSATGMATVALNDLTVDAGSDLSICEGTSKPLNAASNGTSVSWTPSAGLSDATILTPVTSIRATTKYYLQATKGNCTLMDDVVVMVKPSPVANAGEDVTICYQQQTQLQGSGGLTYSWTPTIFLSDPSISNPVVTHPSNSVVYTLQVTDAEDCRSVAPDTVRVNVLPPAQVFAGNDTIIVRDEPLHLNAIDVNGSGFTEYSWTPAFGLDNSAVQDPVALLTDSITYSVSASTQQGCAATASIKVTVYKGPDLYVPTAFTPDGNGHNDVLRLVAAGIRELKYFIVFNRWGQEMFHTVDSANGWDGKWHGTVLAAGTFAWTAEAIDYNGKLIVRKGTVILIR